MRQQEERGVCVKVAVVKVRYLQGDGLQKGEGIAMQRGWVVEMKEHKQPFVCSLRTK